LSVSKIRFRAVQKTYTTVLSRKNSKHKKKVPLGETTPEKWLIFIYSED
jgi:hypothetical protein